MNSEWVPCTVTELLRNRVRQSMHAIACYERTNAHVWQPTTWAQLWDEVRRVSGAFQRMGLGKGDRLAIMARTSQQWQVAEMAGLLAGAVVVGIDPHAAPDQVEHIVRHSGSRCLIVGDFEKVQEIPEAVQARLCLAIALRSPTESGGDSKWHSWDAMVASFAPLKETSFPRVEGDDTATLVYTSGTTGRPKAIEFTHRQLLVACRAICKAFPEINAADSVLCWLPMAHLFQRMMNLVAVAHGARTYFLGDPRDVMTCVQEVQPSVFVGVPRFYERLYEGIQERISHCRRPVARIAQTALRAGDAYARYTREGRRPSLGLRIRHCVSDWLVLRRIRAVMGRNVKFMITGSAPTPRWLLEFFHGIGLLVLEAYGVSENAVPMAANRPDSCRFGSVGKPLPENDIRLADDGEVLVRGPGVFCGYYHEEAPSAQFTADGFYHTGDLGYQDSDGFLYLTGRKRDIIKTSTGRRISPARIEAVYGQSPYVEHVVVIGNGRKYLVAVVTVQRAAIERWAAEAALPSPYSGEELVVTPAVEELVGKEIEHCGQQLAVHERIANWAILPRSLSVGGGELTPTLKIRRDHVNQAYAEVIERLYAESPVQTRGAGEPPAQETHPQ